MIRHRTQDSLPRHKRRIFERATDEGRTRARRVIQATSDWRTWERLASSRGTDWALVAELGVVQAARLLGVDNVFTDDPALPLTLLLSDDAQDAFRWYDIAFRGELDEALDAHP